MRMVVHLAALLLLLLQLSNASPQAPPPPPGRTSDQQIIQCFHHHPSCQCDSHQGAAVAASHLHRPQCLPLQRQALQLLHPHFKQGIEPMFSKFASIFQLLQGITAQLLHQPAGCTTRTAPQKHLLLVWASGLRYFRSPKVD